MRKRNWEAVGPRLARAVVSAFAEVIEVQPLDELLEDT